MAKFRDEQKKVIQSCDDMRNDMKEMMSKIISIQESLQIK